MRQRWVIGAGVILGCLLLTPTAACADEAAAIKTIKKARGTFLVMDKNVDGSPVVHVDLSGVGWRRKIGRAELNALKEFTYLESLSIGFSDFNDVGLYEIRDLKRLKSLSLVDTAVTDAGMKYLKELRGLKELTLAQTRITDAGLRELKDLKGLASLVLSKTRVTDAGMKELKTMPNLVYLTLDWTQVTDRGVYELIETPRLISLLLNETRVTDAGLKYIPYFKNLKQVQVWWCKGVTKAGVEWLREARPGLTIGTKLFL